VVSGHDNISALYRECHGWAVRYQLWNPQAAEPQLVEEYQFGLDRDEVWLQVQHFLMRSSPGSLRVSASSRKLHFPTAINRNDLATFAILRTVYVFSRKEPGTTGSPRHESHVLPLDFNETLKSIWTSNLTGGGQSATIKYTYGIEFSGCGKYALYHDIMGMKFLPKKTDCRVATTLAMFSIRGSDSRQETAAMSQTVRFLGTATGGMDSQYFAGWSFHPTLPVLVVQILSLVARISQNLTLWNFSCGMDSLHVLRGRKPGYRVAR
jgi:hypothetical protein